VRHDPDDRQPGEQLGEEPEQPAGQGFAAIAGLDDPVRRTLYDYVCGQARPVGREEAAEAAGIGRPLAAYHLDRLADLGLLTVDYQRPAGRGGPGAGRPAKVYARSRREFSVTVPPREYELAARLMTQAVESDQTGTALSALLQSASEFGASLARSLQGSGLQGSGLTAAGHAGADDRGVREVLVAVLTAHGFEPWTDANGTIRLRNCPFHQLAARHRETVCGMNLALLAGLADQLDPDSLHAELDPGPDRCCVAIGSCDAGAHAVATADPPVEPDTRMSSPAPRTLHQEHHDQRTDS
jgi:predicted ArsR family transcriptional regulator